MLRLPRSKVQIGAPLPWNVRDEDSLLLLSKGHIIESEHQLELLLERGAFVDVEEIKASAQRSAPDQSAAAIVRKPNIFGLWGQIAKELKALTAGVESEPDFAGRIDHFAQHVVSLVESSVDIAIYQCVRQDHAQHFYYGYSHSVNAAVLCILMADHFQWPRERMMSLVKAALSMNLTILDLQGQMAGQDDPVKDKQRAAIHEHPAQTVALLEKAGVTDAHWLQAVAQHHERTDGSGYPLGTSEICEMAVALRVADVFMAKISPRTMRVALSPQEAIRQLYQEDSGGRMSTAVIKTFGIFPPGDFVKLVSGELGVVVQRTDNVRAPIVAAITNTDGHPVTTTLRHDTRDARLAIVGAVTDKTMLMRLPPERLYGYSALTPVQNASPVAQPS